MKKESMKKMVSTVVIGCMVITAGLGVYAYTDESNTNREANNFGARPQMMAREDRGNGQEKLEELLDTLVTQGSLSEDKADSILAYAEEKHLERQSQFNGKRGMGRNSEAMKQGPKQGIVEDLEQDGIITSEEATVIRDKNDEIRLVEKNARLDEHLAQLVEEGAISSDQVEGVKTFMQEKDSERILDIENTKDMTVEERKAYFDEKRDSIDCLGEMVEAGVITQEQADNLAEQRHFMPRGKMGGRPQNDQRRNQMDEKRGFGGKGRGFEERGQETL